MLRRCLSTGTTTARARSARAPTSRTSTSRRLQAFYRKYYQPDNAVLIVAGKFDEAKTLGDHRRDLRQDPAGRRACIEPTYTLDPAQDGERTVTLRRVGDTPIVLTLYHVPAGSSPTSPRRRSPALMLGGPEFRLHKALVEKELAAEAFGGARALAEPGYRLFRRAAEERASRSSRRATR